MNSKKNIIKEMLHWILAGIVAVLIVNCVGFIYCHQAGWLNRNSGATKNLWYPNDYISLGMEGFGIHKVDSNGYLNDSSVLSDTGYVLAMGSSFTQAKEVMQKDSWVSQLDARYNNGDGKKVYNISQNAHFFPDLISGFVAAKEQFPNSKAIILEIQDTEFDFDELTYALENPRVYNAEAEASNIIDSLSTRQKFSLALKRYIPILNELKNYAPSIDFGQFFKTDEKSESSDVEVSAKDYEKLLCRCMDYLANNYEGEILIVFHPRIEICNDGSAKTVETKFYKEFVNACDLHQRITFIDVGEQMISNYEKTFKVPYGFSNTHVGYGHFNKTGNDIMYAAISPYLDEILK